MRKCICVCVYVHAFGCIGGLQIILSKMFGLEKLVKDVTVSCLMASYLINIDIYIDSRCDSHGLLL